MDTSLVNANILTLTAILQEYKTYVTLMDDADMSGKSMLNMNCKLGIFSDNLDSIRDNIGDLVSDLNGCSLSANIQSSIELSNKTNEICKDFYPYILLRILNDG